MIDSRTNHIITTVRGYDSGFDCRESMKICSKEIRTRGLFGRANCVRRTAYNPTPRLTPGSSEASRVILPGVIMNNKFYIISGKRYNGFYTVESTDGWHTLLTHVRREELSITKGCN